MEQRPSGIAGESADQPAHNFSGMNLNEQSDSP
jgi:hypothetical protein